MDTIGKIFVGHNQILTIKNVRYRAEWWNGKPGHFELILIDEEGKDYGLQRFTREEIYKGIEAKLLKKI